MLEAKNLYKGYGKKNNPFLRDINLVLEPGQIYGLIGENGSGKTTLIKCLNGIYPADVGTVCIDSEEIFENAQAKDKIGYVADSNQFYPSQSVGQLLELYRGLFPDFSMEDFAQLNKRFEVPLKARIARLSKGQQMRVSFMLNAARNPKVLLMDEPTSGLDVLAKKILFEEVVKLVEEKNTAVLIASHHLDDLEKLCDKIMIMKKGSLVIEDEVDNITNVVTKYQVVFETEMPDEVKAREDVLQVDKLGRVYTVVVRGQSEEFATEMKAAGAIMVDRLSVTLEESFAYRLQNGGQNE